MKADFISKSIKASFLPVLVFGSYSNLFPSTILPFSSDYSLAAIKGGEPEDMFHEAIKAFGGMTKFVKKGQTVETKYWVGR